MKRATDINFFGGKSLIKESDFGFDGKDNCPVCYGHLRKKVMRRVYLIWFARSSYAKILVTVALACVAVWHISFVDIFRNASQSSGSVLSFVNYWAVNFVKADIASIVLGVAMLGLLSYFGWNVASRKILPQFTFFNFSKLSG